MKTIRDVLKLLQKNLGVLLQFEILYTMIGMLVRTGLLSLLNMTMRVQNFNYLTLDNLFAFVRRPLTIIILLFIVAVLTILSLVEIQGILFIIDAGYQKKKVSFVQVLKYLVNHREQMFSLHYLSVCVIVLLLMPFLQIGISAGIINQINIPGFIEDYIYTNVLYTVLVSIGTLLLLWLLLRWMFAFHYVFIEGKSYKDAKQASVHLTKKRHIRLALWMTVMPIGIAAVWAVAAVLLIVVLLVINNLLASHAYTNAVLSSVGWLLLLFMVLVYGVTSIAMGYMLMTVLFYRWKEIDGEPIKHIEIQETEKSPKRVRTGRIVTTVIAALCVGIGSLMIYGIYYGTFDISIDSFSKTYIAAHRGASTERPENTMEAFERAVELNADWIELDVQQSKDGQIFVCHDSNLYRITGVDVNGYDLTYDEIRELDAGSFFDEQYNDSYIPLLSEVIDFAKKNNVNLNIELKPSAYDTDFEKTIIEIIKEKNFENNCVLASLNYECLENIKAITDDIPTLYISAFAYGNILDLDAADGFSLEAESVTESMVDRIHGAGKRIWVWTVNTESEMRQFSDMGVDYILTDDVTLAKETLESNALMAAIQDLIALFSHGNITIVQE